MKKLTSQGFQGVELTRSLFAAQIDLSVDLLLSISNDDLLYGFRKRRGVAPNPGHRLDGWYGTGVFHVFGQILGGTARLYRATQDERMYSKAMALLEGWHQCIREDGYAFNNENGCNDPYYEYEKLCGGLCDCIEFLHADIAADGLSRLTDWAMENLDTACTQIREDKTPYFEWHTLGENLFRAHALTGDDKYLAFARRWEYPYFWDQFKKPVEKMSITPRHAYSHVNTLSSAAMAYQATGEQSYLDIIQNAYDYLTGTQIYATGGYGPRERIFCEEGHLGKVLIEPLEVCFGHVEAACCSWATLKLCRYLMEFTGDAKYADWTEKIIYNVLLPLLAPLPNGKIMYYAYYYLCGAVKNRHDGRFNHPNGITFEWACCSGSYFEAIPEYADTICFHDREQVYIAQYIPSRCSVALEEGDVSVEIDTRYPFENTVAIAAQVRRGHTVLNLRKPLWAKSMKINGQEREANAQGWIAVPLASGAHTLTVEIAQHLYFVPADREHRNLSALCYGPVVLTSDYPGLFTADAQTPSDWIEKGEGLAFETKPGTSCSYPERIHRFKPFFSVEENEVYYMYHLFEEPKENSDGGVF